MYVSEAGEHLRLRIITFLKCSFQFTKDDNARLYYHSNDYGAPFITVCRY